MSPILKSTLALKYFYQNIYTVFLCVFKIFDILQLDVILTCEFIETLRLLGFTNFWIHFFQDKKVLKDKNPSIWWYGYCFETHIASWDIQFWCSISQNFTSTGLNLCLSFRYSLWAVRKNWSAFTQIMLLRSAKTRDLSILKTLMAGCQSRYYCMQQNLTLSFFVLHILYIVFFSFFKLFKLCKRLFHSRWHRSSPWKMHLMMKVTVVMG